MKVYMIYRYHYDYYNHLGYCTNENEAKLIIEQLNKKHNPLINTHWYDELKLMTVKEEK